MVMKAFQLEEKQKEMEANGRFDPCPVSRRGTVHERLPSLSDKIHGENLCVSLLLDMRFCHWDSQLLPADPVLPDIAMLRQTVEAFKASWHYPQKRYEGLNLALGSRETQVYGLT